MMAASRTRVVLLPFAVAGGISTAFEQVVTTQLRRPGGDISGGSIEGVVDLLDHLGSFGVFGFDRLGGPVGLLGVILAAGAVVWAWRTDDVNGRFFAALVVLGALVVTLAPDYYDQYPVTVFAGIAVLLGGAAAALGDALARRSERMRTIVTIVVGLFLVTAVADTVGSFVRERRSRALGSTPRRTVP